MDLITLRGLSLLKGELNELRDEIESMKQRVEQARSYGDLRENADYSTLSRNLSIKTRKFNKLLHTVLNSNTGSDSDDETSGFGRQVFLTCGKESVSYSIAGKHEYGVFEDYLYCDSDMARRLTGLRVNDTLTIEDKVWKIKSIYNLNKDVNKNE